MATRRSQYPDTILFHEAAAHSPEEAGLLASVVDASPNIVVVKDEQGRIVWLNDAAARFLGLPAEELRGKTLMELPAKTSLDVDWFTHEDEAVIRKRRLLRSERYLTDSSGESRWYSITKVPVVEHDGACRYVAVIAIDTTETKLRERQLEDAQREYLRAISLRDEFLSLASHELRTPIASLKLELELAQRRLKRELRGEVVGDRVGRLLDNSRRHVAALASLVDDMLDVSRIQMRRFSVEKRSLDLAELVREVAERFRAPLNAAGCDLAIEAEPGVIGEWDRARIDQVLSNLLSNAVKYAPGGPVTIAVRRDGANAILSVTDRGRGIARERHAQLFELFWRDPHDVGINGLGLGLFIVRKIVEAHGGTVRVDSELAHGTTFTVVLPLKPVS